MTEVQLSGRKLELVAASCTSLEPRDDAGTLSGVDGAWTCEPYI